MSDHQRIDVCPVLAVFDVEESIQYYEDVLGFPGHWSEGDPPDWGGVSGVVMNFKSGTGEKGQGISVSGPGRRH